jgi:hypothetical protein
LEPLISKSRVVCSFYRFYRSFLDDSPSPSHISGEIDPAEPWPQPAPWPQPLEHLATAASGVTMKSQHPRYKEGKMAK